MGCLLPLQLTLVTVVMFVHVGVRPYRCDQCDKAFTQRCSLESHTRKVHGIELNFAYKQRRPKTYVCEECGHTASQPELHYLHLRRLHPYSPALARSHDKRLFKFAAESPLLPSGEWKWIILSSNGQRHYAAQSNCSFSGFYNDFSSRANNVVNQKLFVCVSVC